MCIRLLAALAIASVGCAHSRDAPRIAKTEEASAGGDVAAARPDAATEAIAAEWNDARPAMLGHFRDAYAQAVGAENVSACFQEAWAQCVVGARVSYMRKGRCHWRIREGHTEQTHLAEQAACGERVGYDRDKRRELGESCGHHAVSECAEAASGGRDVRERLSGDAAYREPSIADIVEYARRAVVTVLVPDGLGSGFHIGGGLIVTNFHVVEGAESVSIRMHDGRVEPIASVVAVDPDRDLVVLRTDAVPAAALDLAMEPIRSGDAVVALGSPRGLELTVTAGIVSALRDISGVQLVQHTASISPGSSGGPLLNSNGEVIAINTMYLTDSQNLNFSVVASELAALIDAAADQAVEPGSTPGSQQHSAGAQ